MKRPRPKATRWYGYYDSRVVNQMVATSRSEAFAELWKIHRGQNRNAQKHRFTVDNESAEIHSHGEPL